MTVQLATNVDQPLPTMLASDVLSGPLEGMAVVEGRMPSWLHGRLIRTAPAVFEFGNWRAKHWFDALGMLYAFDIDADGRVRWAQRLLECEFSKSVLAATPGTGGFGTPDGRRFIQRLLHPVPRTTDNTNVNILPTGVNWTALTETDRQLLIDPATLRTPRTGQFRHHLRREEFDHGVSRAGRLAAAATHHNSTPAPRTVPPFVFNHALQGGTDPASL
jgi:carotenoid cleavage dioxygenase-like enzyme